MLLFRILSRLGGYVTITLPEGCLEKFVNLAVSRGVFLWDITGIGTGRVAMKVRLSGVQALRHVARMTSCRFKIVERQGLPFFVSRMKRRRAMTAGALIFVAALYVLSSFVWFIEVTGNKLVTDQAVEQVARQAGLKLGVPRWTLDVTTLEETILDQVPGLSWVGVYVEGTRVYIKVVEKKLPPPDETGHPVDVVAIKDGLVKQILVLSGHPEVKEGDTVTSGQVLISAAIPPPVTDEEKETPDGNREDALEPEVQQPLRYVHARGIVRARVWYEGVADMRLVENGAEITGHETTRFGIKFGSKEIILIGPRKIPFEHYAVHVEGKRAPVWRNIDVPVELLTVRYYEENPYTKSYTRDEARRLAGRKALDSIRGQLPEGAKIVDERLEEVETLDSGTVRVRAVVETLEDIGIDQPHQSLDS
ncbi:MAG TPA: sporulation protein YqfD [Desulfotomaculum sp.]|nr:MAG: hypothetical protein VR67_14315 [Peptococcaceae bacterium BRH_c8a]KJS74115.1 MAG: hypothetical protein JL56_09910 [Desulfotomaculum sp. BICA1-6]HBX22840.1 sporulation protein YqfD [Desulfotomaculum sp.]